MGCRTGFLCCRFSGHSLPCLTGQPLQHVGCSVPILGMDLWWLPLSGVNRGVARSLTNQEPFLLRLDHLCYSSASGKGPREKRQVGEKSNDRLVQEETKQK